MAEYKYMQKIEFAASEVVATAKKLIVKTWISCHGSLRVKAGQKRRDTNTNTKYKIQAQIHYLVNPTTAEGQGRPKKDSSKAELNFAKRVLHL